jgi:hypothetical protein
MLNFIKDGLFLCLEYLKNPTFNAKNAIEFLVKVFNSIDSNRLINLSGSGKQLVQKVQEEQAQDVSSLEFYLNSKEHLNLYRKSKITFNFIDASLTNVFDFNSLVLYFYTVFIRNSNLIITGLFIK